MVQPLETDYVNKHRTGACPNCHIGTAHERVAFDVRFWPRGGAHDPFVPDEKPPTELDLMTYTGWSIYRCASCRKTYMILVLHRPRIDRAAMSSTDGGSSPPGLVFREEVTEVMVWPGQKPRELPEEAPDGVRSLFVEAATCEAGGSMRAAGVMYRATVEELVEDGDDQDRVSVL